MLILTTLAKVAAAIGLGATDNTILNPQPVGISTVYIVISTARFSDTLGVICSKPILVESSDATRCGVTSSGLTAGAYVEIGASGHTKSVSVASFSATSGVVCAHADHDTQYLKCNSLTLGGSGASGTLTKGVELNVQTGISAPDTQFPNIVTTPVATFSTTTGFVCYRRSSINLACNVLTIDGSGTLTHGADVVVDSGQQRFVTPILVDTFDATKGVVCTIAPANVAGWEPTVGLRCFSLTLSSTTLTVGTVLVVIPSLYTHVVHVSLATFGGTAAVLCSMNPADSKMKCIPITLEGSGGLAAGTPLEVSTTKAYFPSVVATGATSGIACYALTANSGDNYGAVTCNQLTLTNSNTELTKGTAVTAPIAGSRNDYISMLCFSSGVTAVTYFSYGYSAIVGNLIGCTEGGLT